MTERPRYKVAEHSYPHESGTWAILDTHILTVYPAGQVIVEAQTQREADSVAKILNAHKALVDAVKAARERMNCPNCDDGLCAECSERFGDVWHQSVIALKLAGEL